MSDLSAIAPAFNQLSDRAIITAMAQACELWFSYESDDGPRKAVEHRMSGLLAEWQRRKRA